MIFQLFKLRWLLLLAAAVGMAVSSGQAKPPATNEWQDIVFSTPTNAEVSSNLVVQPSSSSSDFENRLHLFQDQSPVSFFANPSVPAAPMVMPIPRPRFKRPAEDHLDWEFMTPAQILGVAPDQILNTQQHDANGAQSSLTPMERFLERQNLSSRVAANAAGKASASQDFSNNRNDQPDTVANLFHNLFGNNSGSVQAPVIFNQSSDNVQNNVQNQNNSLFTDGGSGWSKLFGTSQPTPASNPARDEQNMSEFLRLFNPSSTPITAATPPVESTPLAAQTGLPGFDSTTPLADPIGAPFASLKSGIGKPSGLAPLPAITPQVSAESATRPAWAPQPPPWLSPAPQPFAIPQRKF